VAAVVVAIEDAGPNSLGAVWLEVIVCSNVTASVVCASGTGIAVAAFCSIGGNSNAISACVSPCAASCNKAGTAWVVSSRARLSPHAAIAKTTARANRAASMYFMPFMVYPLCQNKKAQTEESIHTLQLPSSDGGCERSFFSNMERMIVSNHTQWPCTLAFALGAALRKRP